MEASLWVQGPHHTRPLYACECGVFGVEPSDYIASLTRAGRLFQLEIRIRYQPHLVLELGRCLDFYVLESYNPQQGFSLDRVQFCYWIWGWLALPVLLATEEAQSAIMRVVPTTLEKLQYLKGGNND